MAEDWAIDVRKYAPDADDATIAGIVRHCGIALQSRDASLVSFTDPAELLRVRESYCRKKLGLSQSDEEIDAEIYRVGERMKDDHTKNRVTVYYLLAESFGKLGLFGGTAATAAVAAAPAAAAMPAASIIPAVAASAATTAPAFAAAPAAMAPQRPHPRDRDGGGMLGTALGTLGLLGVVVIGTATLGSLIGNRDGQPPDAPAAPPAAMPAAAPAPAPLPAAPAIPEGSGVVAQEVAGKPQVSVYFDTSSADISADFPAVAAPIKAWIDANPGSRLAVSGYNDPRGDAAMNAELSKNRAQNVAAALAAMGVPEGVIDLEKPPETSDTTTTLENARRVDIMVRDGS